VQVDAVASNQQAKNLNINPLLPPPGVHLIKFQDALLRTLTTVFHLDQPASLALRQALHEAYQAAGWTALERGRALLPQDLAQQIEQTVRQGSLPGEITRRLQISCAFPLRDLETTAGKLFETSGPPDWSPGESLIVSVGWLGSDESRIFMRGCLWSWFSLALAAAPAANANPRGLLSLEEAHLFFGCKTSQMNGPTMGQLVQQNTANRVGTLLIDDRPDLLDEEILQRALLILVAQQNHPAAVERTATFLGLSSRQHTRMAHLQNTEILVTSGHSNPFLVAL
jgi:hypothetical protein